MLNEFLETLGITHQYTPKHLEIIKKWCQKNIGETYCPAGELTQQYQEYLVILKNYHQIFQPAIAEHQDTIDGQSIFWYGLNHGYFNAIRGLAIDLNAPIINLLTPIHIASFYGYPKIFAWLLENNVNLHQFDHENRNVLHHALFMTNISSSEMQEVKKNMAKQLIHRAPELITQKDLSGTTPIHLMASNPIFSDFLYSILKKHPEYQFMPDNIGNHPIHLAIMNAPDIANWMLDNPQVQNIQLPRNHQYPIHMIAIDGDLNLMEKCCKHSDINLTDDYLKTPLILAAEFHHPELVNFLLGQGANPELKDHQGKTYLDYMPSPRPSRR